MPDEWTGHLENLELPDGLDVEGILEAMSLVWEWCDSYECSPAPLVVKIFNLLSERQAGVS